MKYESDDKTFKNIILYIILCRRFYSKVTQAGIYHKITSPSCVWVRERERERERENKHSSLTYPFKINDCIFLGQQIILKN